MTKSRFKNVKKAAVTIPLALCLAFSIGTAACGNDSSSPSDDKNDNEKREDEQVLLNGDFEFFDLPSEGKYEYLIRTPDDWSVTGTTSAAKSGIISTSESAWNKLTADDLAERLDANADLKTSDSDYKEKYIDFNGMQSKDIPYKDAFAALNPIKAFDIEEKDGKYYIKDADGNDQEVFKGDDTTFYKDEALTQLLDENAKDTIENPGNHYGVTKEGDTVDGKSVKLDANDNLYYENTDGDETEKVYLSNVLMVHNYASSHNGITSGYASTSVDLPANTSAEISVWVKTSNMTFDQGVNLNDDQDRGAYIKISQTVGGNSLDAFKIRAINTEKLAEINGAGTDSHDYFTSVSSNGWVQYTVYVNACDFADSTVTVTLGLGEDGNENLVEGYAFFDDVVVKKFKDNIYETGEESTFTAQQDKVEKTTCYLVSDENEKTFSADDYYVNGSKTEDRSAKNFHYLIDLASQGKDADSYKPFAFGTNVTADLTVDETDKSKNKYYAAATSNGDIIKQNITLTNKHSDLTLPEGLRGVPRKTDNDLLGIYDVTAADPVAANTFDGKRRTYTDTLNEALNTAKDLPSASEGNVLLMLSVQGAPYTAVINDNSEPSFTVAKDSYKIISFWVKTSKDSTAKISLIDTEDADRERLQTISVDTTDVTTDIDDEHEDIYNGWVQCFFFVKNETEDEKSFTLEFNYGLTDLKSTSATSYKGGWAALANMQVLTFDKEEVFNYVSSGDHAAIFDFSEEEKEDRGQFDTPVSTVKDGFGTPTSYTGYNGGSSGVVATEKLLPRYDDENTNPTAGLLTKKYMEDYKNASPAWLNTLVTKFSSLSLAVASADEIWNEVFGSSSTQPLVIVNNLRTLAETAKVTKEQFEADPTSLYKYDNGRKEYVQLTAEEEYDPDETYYSSVKKAMNYGFVSGNNTVSANDGAIISVKVKVSAGAKAYVYLTNDEYEVMDFTTPKVSFWYDEEGNVLKGEPKDGETKAEHRANIAYTYRQKDGLYEDKDGTLYANLHSLKKYYTDESKTYYKDKSGQESMKISFDDLETGVEYYYENGDTANHYLINSDEATKNNPLYEYFEGKYYYRVNRARGPEVKDFDETVAVPRYTMADKTAQTPYSVLVDGGTEGKTATVSFYINTGSEAKNYRLELWSGKRDSSGVEDDGTVSKDASEEGSAIIFDYSFLQDAWSSSDFADARAYYEQLIIEEYKDLLAKNDEYYGEITAKDSTIADFEKLIDKLGESDPSLKSDAENIRKTYYAFYYTYSFYDSEDFAPFNASTAKDGETGYEYNPLDYSESLAYLKYQTETEKESTISVFVDYSTVEQDISLHTTGDDDDNDVGGGETSSGGESWLLISSIILVVALVFALLSLLIRNLLKKRRVTAGGRSRRVDNGEGKRKRYLKWLRISKSEYEDVDIDS